MTSDLSQARGTDTRQGAPAPTQAPPSRSDDTTAITTRQRSQAELVLRRFFRHRLAVASLIVFLLLNAFAFLGDFFWKFDYKYIDAPGSIPWFTDANHPFGTDSAGHDLLGQTIRGAQQSLKISLTVALIATAVGAVWGAVAGFYRGKVDGVMMRVVDVILTLPAIAVAITLAANFRGGAGWIGIALVLSFLVWAGISRVVRGVVLSLREMEFVEAARAMGASDLRIVFRHLLPNALGPMIVAATITIAAAILAETALSFLGFGVVKPDTSLGNMITEAQLAVQTRPWLFYVPGFFIILIALTINFIGDGLRDAFDPRQSQVRK
jgi:ABC-type dipeptide/oligopeptide/nickel transport system permease subunit